MERIKEKLKEIEVEYKELQDGIIEYSNNNLSSMDLKPRGSKFGIYEQKGKKMMLRLKAVGGELSVKKLKALASIMEEKNIPYIHLSTRQNYQLHEVDFEKVKETIEACNEHEMYFRGGGGNTFRSILVSTYTGINKNEVFDVMPYGRMVENEVFFYDKAFQFGRKLKIGFANDTENEFVMAVQDMGFIARELNGKRGFKVYFGGGMGRNSRIGHILMEFLPEEDLLKSVISMIDLFYDHGDRTNRMKARLRFLVEAMGVEEFKKLYFEYFNKSTVENGKFSKIDYEKRLNSLVKFNDNIETDSTFEEWKNICAKETKFKDVVSLALYVKNGDLPLDKLNKLNDLLEKAGVKKIRATINQNLVIPMVHESALKYIYNYLIKEIPEIVTEAISIRGQLRACVGVKTCMIGVQDSKKIADEIGEELDKLAQEKPEYRDIIFKEAKNVRISGCPSSCAGIPAAPLGFIGLKKRIDGAVVDCMQVYVGGILTNGIQSLSLEVPNLILPINEIPLFVRRMFEDYLEELEKYDITFSQYMYNRRLEEF
ncbi:MAG: nitrite/sulfite reductase [Cetobacterium sp.]